MIRLWTSEKLQAGLPVNASEKQVHYLFHVMRMTSGRQIALFNGTDGEWLCDIQELTKKCGLFLPQTQTRAQEPETGPILAFALIKKDNMDWVLQKATELGVRRLVPLLAARSVVHQLNRERAQAILIEAAEQCERLTVPNICEPLSVSQFLSKREPTETVVYLSERGQTNGVVPKGRDVCFVVGPEGGWTEEELSQLSNHLGAVSLNLGRLILRAETASVAILAAAQFDIFCPKSE